MRVRLVPILSDNFSYLLIDEATRTAAIVDPGSAAPIMAALSAEGVEPTHILCTHHHHDHIGGNDDLLEAWPSLVIAAGEIDAERIAGCRMRLADGQEVRIGELSGTVHFTPCHTRGHVAYVFGDALFCGDTLFVGGCGRFFEGTAADMHRALNEVFAQLPGDTRVFCGHEYTIGNLEFAATIEPDNPAIAEKLAWARAERAAARPTVPSTLVEERRYNPFMRVDQPAVQAAVGAEDPVEVMSRLRERKNAFR